MASVGLSRRESWSLSAATLFAVLAFAIGGCNTTTGTADNKPQPEQGDDPPAKNDPDAAQNANDPKQGEPSEPKPGDKPTAPPQDPFREKPSDPTKPGDPPKDFVEPHPFPRGRPSPSLEGGLAWFNTAGPIDVKDLRGKFVILDFWTYCCINCIQVLPELKKLEKAYPNEVVVIGVHSAKFDTEKGTENIREAILRYEIEHPVINDAEHKVWDNFFVNSWPSFRIIDPEGNLIGGDSGEIDFESFDAFLKRYLPYYRKRGLLDTSPLHFDLEAHKQRATPLRFPGKILADEKGKRLFIADSNHNRVVVSSLDGKLIDTIGSGAVGTKDGDYAIAEFNHPQGLWLDGDMLWVADTENHMIRKVDLKAKTVATVSGNGKQRRGMWPMMGELKLGPFGQPELPDKWVGKPKETELASPWALLIHDKNLYIAMAGPHQIWKMPLDESEIGPWAGNGREDIVDGPHIPKRPHDLGYASFAQPSGLTTDGTYLYVADSEGSAIRAVPFDTKKEVTTVVGKSLNFRARLFDFGDVDGKGDEVRLQHALGVAYHNGKIYVADTYNNKVKEVDPKDKTSLTIIGDGKPGKTDDPPRLDEPNGVSVAGDVLYIADTNNHLIRTFNLKTRKFTTLKIEGLKPPTVTPTKHDPAKVFADIKPVDLPVAKVPAADGKIRLRGRIELPFGWKINKAAPMTYWIDAASGGELLAAEALGKLHSIDKPGENFEIVLPAKSTEGKASLNIGLQFYYCRDGAEGVCKEQTSRFTLPIEIDANAPSDAGKPALEIKVDPGLKSSLP